MTPERWQQVNRLFDEALELPLEKRPAYLARACQGDEALRTQVESLIASASEPELRVDHLLQSAALARKAGHSEKVVMACLLHDIAVVGFIRCDHGYWGAQMIAPYVDDEVSEAIRMHQALRFFPDESYGYGYPDLYKKYFGDDYQPEPYIVEEYKRARDSKYYGTSRLVCVNDVYAFDPNAKVELEQFEDIIGRNFKQPKEGLGWDNSPSAHMWRTIMWPTRFL